MRALVFAAAAALTLAACGSRNTADNTDLNAMTDANMMTDQNMMVDQNGAAMAGPGGMDANVATNAATENAMMQDMNTNDRDTNLANGM
jgi:hypothetical protein